jgi:hypothetical protein
MSYWFGEPHTLVLARARMICAIRGRAINSAPSPSALQAPSFWPYELERCSGSRRIFGQADQNSRRAEPRNRSLIRRLRRNASPGQCRGI